MEVVYSRGPHPLAEGRTYQNPRFFSGTLRGAEAVYLVGDHPKIAAAYEAAGIPVRRVDEPVQRQRRVLEPPATLPAPVSTDERAAIYIPDDWRDLGWTKPTEGRDITLRGLASMFSDEPVLNKAMAVAAIEAELRRRALDELALIDAETVGE